MSTVSVIASPKVPPGLRSPGVREHTLHLGSWGHAAYLMGSFIEDGRHLPHMVDVESRIKQLALAAMLVTYEAASEFFT